MLFFRSEEDKNAWVSRRGLSREGALSLAQLWYHNRLDPDYGGRSREQAIAIFEQVGLTSAFWKA
jgi:hypothetical protein